MLNNQVKNWKQTFFIIWIGQMFSLLGSSVAQFAVIWWLTMKTGSPLTLAIAMVVGFLPQAVIGPFAGVWVDRISRRKIMMISDLFIALASLILAIAFLFGTPPVWLIYVILFFRALGGVFHAPALQAAIPMLVPEDYLVKAGGMSEFIRSGALMAGPVLGAMIIEMMPMSGVMLIDIAGAVIAVTSLVFIRIPDPEKQQTDINPHILHDMKEGFHTVRKNKGIITVSVFIMLAMIIHIPAATLFPLMISNHFAGGAWHLGITEFVFAGGLMLSSALIGMWGGLKRRFLMISLSLTALGVFVGASGLLAPDMFWLFVVFSALLGATGNFMIIPFIAYVQAKIPPQELGRVLSLISSAMSVSTPIGLFAAAPVAQVIGISNWFLLSGVVTATIGTVCIITTYRYDSAEYSG